MSEIKEAVVNEQEAEEVDYKISVEEIVKTKYNILLFLANTMQNESFAIKERLRAAENLWNAMMDDDTEDFE